jgi:hypothetical protein
MPKSRYGIIACLALTSTWAAVGYAADDEHASADANISSKMKATGAAAKRDAKVVGAAVKEDAEKVKIGAKKVAHEVADAAKKGAHEVKVVAKEIAEKTKEAVKHGSTEQSDKKHEP